jgi:DNA repair photolyase
MKNIFGTLEWASHNENFVSGCSHNCLYCYSKEMAIRFKRKNSENWQVECVSSDKLNKKFKKFDGRVMFPSSHDITPNILTESMLFLNRLLEAGNDILLVSKPHIKCIEMFCKKFVPYKKNILMRFTIGSLNSDILKIWEPNAPDFNERFSCLKHAFENGFQTSLSIEPILDNIDNTSELIEKCLPYITDAVWIGKPNFLIRRLRTNGVLTAPILQKATELENILKDDEIKRLYKNYKSNKKIKWKDSIKTIMGVKKATSAGQDI